MTLSSSIVIAYCSPLGGSSSVLPVSLALSRNRHFIVDYGDLHRHGDLLFLAEAFAHDLIDGRLDKAAGDQMSWSLRNAHDLLQIRTAVLNGELREQFDRTPPGCAAANEENLRAAA